ncbi:MAG: hypothetical protein JNJ54_35855 [Myxococcaceae bacterium]|nr:hypothetical protein [Myxococcaceae bacterium]
MTEPRRRALVVFETIFGNTRQIAEAIAAGLAAHFEVTLAEASANPSPEGMSLIVVGGPIHAFGMSRPTTRENAEAQAEKLGIKDVHTGAGVREWLERLPPATGQVDAATFDTAVKVGWFVIGSAARGEASLLSARGYTMTGRPQHFFVKDMDGPLMPGELERARAWGQGVAELTA